MLHHEHGLDSLLFSGLPEALALPVLLFLAGLAGGFAHCAGMCGPFVLSQVSAGLARRPVSDMAGLRRLRGGLLLPYHAGRIVSYALLGGVAGLIGGGVAALSGWRFLVGVALLAAAALFMDEATGARFRRRLALAAAGEWSARLSRRAAPLLREPGPMRGFALGLLLGLLPCGLLYAALAAAAGTGGFLPGMLAMAAFAAGTVPALVLVGLLGGAMLARWRGAASLLARAVMAANALFLAYLASRTLL
ncbi:MAG: sulfite exporter TauE/SafE family protein [Alphaproteobacteria bacterium]|nr:sulfite exporter TauE/SafE family protein [Alphaproteobacteria bacterium]